MTDNKKSIKQVASYWRRFNCINNVENVSAVADLFLPVSQPEIALVVNDQRPSALSTSVDVTKKLHDMIRAVSACKGAEKSRLIDDFIVELDNLVGEAKQMGKKMDLNTSFKDAGNQLATLLHTASRCNVPEIVTHLIEVHEMSTECKDKKYATPLHYACSSGSVESCQILLSNQANSMAKDETENFPLLLALRTGNYQCADALLMCKADINMSGTRGDTCLHAACDRGDVKALRYLFNCSASDRLILPSKNRQDQYPVFLALKHPEALKVILTKMKDHSDNNAKSRGESDFNRWITYCDSSGQNMFHVCADKGYLDSLLILVDHYNDKQLVDCLNKRDSRDSTPFSLSVSKHNYHISHLFLLSSEVYDAFVDEESNVQFPRIIPARIHWKYSLMCGDPSRDGVSQQFITLTNKLYVACIENQERARDSSRILRIASQLISVLRTGQYSGGTEYAKFENMINDLVKKLGVDPSVDLELLHVCFTFIETYVVGEVCREFVRGLIDTASPQPSHKKMLINEYYDINNDEITSVLEGSSSDDIVSALEVDDVEVAVKDLFCDPYAGTVVQRERAEKIVQHISTMALGLKRVKLSETPYPFVVQHDLQMVYKRLMLDPLFLWRCQRLDQLVLDEGIHSLSLPLFVLCMPRVIGFLSVDSCDLGLMIPLMADPYQCLNAICHKDGLLSALNKDNKYRQRVTQFLHELFGDISVESAVGTSRYATCLPSCLDIRGPFKIGTLIVNGITEKRCRDLLERSSVFSGCRIMYTVDQ